MDSHVGHMVNDIATVLRRVGDNTAMNTGNVGNPELRGKSAIRTNEKPRTLAGLLDGKYRHRCTG